MVQSESQIQAIRQYTTRLSTLHNKWKAKKHQAEVIKTIFSDGYKRIFIRGGRKSSKTEISLYLSHRVCAMGQNKIASIIGPELKQQKKIVWNNKRLQDFAPKDWRGKPNSETTSIKFPWGSFIEVDGADNAESHRGEEQDLIVLDELKDHKLDSYEAMYPNLAARDGILVIVGTPPKHKKNLFYKLEMQATQDPAWKVFHWTCWDNDEIDRIWLEREKNSYYRRGDEWLWQIEYEGNYVFGGKDAVFAVFSEHEHVLPPEVIDAAIAKDKHKLEYFIVSDPGNRICHANLFIAYDKSNNHVWVLDEIYETKQSETATSKIGKRILEKAEELFPSGTPDYWIYDEAALWFTTEMGALFPNAPAMCPTNKAVRDKETSIGIIKTCMADGKYHQSESCNGLKEELLAYYLDNKGNYVKQDDHAIDCLRYFFDFVGYDYQLTPQSDIKTKQERDEMFSDKKKNNPLYVDVYDVSLEEGMIWNS